MILLLWKLQGQQFQGMISASEIPQTAENNTQVEGVLSAKRYMGIQEA